MTGYARYKRSGAGDVRRRQMADWIDTFQPFIEVFGENVEGLELGTPHYYPPPAFVRTGTEPKVRLLVRWLLKPEPLAVAVDINEKGYEIEARGRERAVTIAVNRRPVVGRFRNDLVTALRAADLLPTFPMFGMVKDAQGNTWPRCSPDCDLQIIDSGGVKCSCDDPDSEHAWAVS